MLLFLCVMSAGPSVHIARIQGGGSVGFDDCVINTWDAYNNDEYAIVANGTGTVIVRGTEFQHSGNQISLGPQLGKAVIVGNVFTGTTRIAGVQPNNVRFQVGLNAADE